MVVGQSKTAIDATRSGASASTSSVVTPKPEVSADGTKTETHTRGGRRGRICGRYTYSRPRTWRFGMMAQLGRVGPGYLSLSSGVVLSASSIPPPEFHEVLSTRRRKHSDSLPLQVKSALSASSLPASMYLNIAEIPCS